MANNDLLGAILSWVPMILLIGVWIYFMRRYSGPGGAASTNQKILAEYQRHNELMEKVVDRMDQRIRRLEDADREQNK